MPFINNNFCIKKKLTIIYDNGVAGGTPVATSSIFSNHGNNPRNNRVRTSARAVWNLCVISENIGIVSWDLRRAICLDKYIWDRQYAPLKIASNVPSFSTSKIEKKIKKFFREILDSNVIKV